MPSLKYYIVDAFTIDKKPFSGNPAGVCFLDERDIIDTEMMQSIAAENNLAETAFVSRNKEGGANNFDLRWFTPEGEIDLCGHATLASAFFIYNYVYTNFPENNAEETIFNTRSGPLNVVKNGGLYEMDFPSFKPSPTAVTPLMSEAIGTEVLEAYVSRDLLLLVDDEETVKNLKPDFELIKKLTGCLGVIVTAEGKKNSFVDFVSRYFAPNVGTNEDHVTGSSHAMLIPYWAKKLGRPDNQKMTAMQLSKRGGMIFCENCGNRVKIDGKASLYLAGKLLL